jgi:enterochelin esterase-like enzyme
MHRLIVLFFFIFVSMLNAQQWPLPFSDSGPAEKNRVVAAAFMAESPRSPVIIESNWALVYFYGDAGEVTIQGDYQEGWSRQMPLQRIDCGEEDFFYYEFRDIPADTRVDYILVVDGNAGPDPRNPRQTPSGFGSHSELAMPGFKRTSLLRLIPGARRGEMTSVQWQPRDAALAERRIEVYLPNNFDSTFVYPILLVHDGQEALQFAFMRKQLDNLISARIINPLIAVFVPPVEREAEYVEALMPAYSKAMHTDLLPFLATEIGFRYRAKQLAVMGISNGGHLAYMSFFSYPDVYTNVAGQSSTILPHVLQAAADAVATGRLRSESKIYVDTGRFDLYRPLNFLTANREFHIRLLNLGIDHQYEEFNDGHAWANWRERKGAILKYFYEGWE